MAEARLDTGPEPHALGETWRAALREAVRPRSLRRSGIAAGLVGTTLLLANLGGRLAEGSMSTGLALQIFLTYAVPWCNATIGIAIGLRDRGC
jgi:hypothetical protein